MKIGNKISELRKKANETQEQLALKLNVTRQTLSSWESDITSPDLKQAAELSKIFKVNINDLVDDNLAIECKNNSNNIFNSLIGKECYLDTKISDDDYRIYNSPCKIISINDDFVKFEFVHNKKTISKLIDINLIDSFKIVTKKEGK